MVPPGKSLRSKKRGSIRADFLRRMIMGILPGCLKGDKVGEVNPPPGKRGLKRK
jgi:hypothetical protein